MSVVSGSVFCQFFLALGLAFSHAWGGSVLRRLCFPFIRAFRAVSAVWKRWWHGSALVRFFFEHEGALPRAWPESFCCRALSLLVNLPVAVLHWIYVKLRPWFEGSALCPFIFGLGEQVPVALGWLMLLVMNIDYAKWSNSYSFLGLVLLLLLFLAGGMRRRSLRLDVAGVGLYPAVFFLAVCLSWPMSLYPALSGRYLVYHVTCALCVVLTVSAVETAGQLERLACFGCLGMVGAAAWGIVQRFQGVAVIRAYVDIRLNPDMPGRVYSFFNNPNAFAEMLVMLIPVGGALFLGSGKRSFRMIGLLSAGLGAVALVMTYSRASWIGLVVAAVVFLFFWNRKLIPVLAVLGLACLPLLPGAVLQRIQTIFNLNDTSTSSRLPLMEAGLRIIKAHPILGAGLGGDAVRQASMDMAAYSVGYSVLTHAHNIYIQLWLENGLLGIAAFAAGCWHALKEGVGVFQREGVPRSTRFIVLGAASALAGSLVSGLADYLFNYPRVMLIFWFSVSLLMAGVKLARRGGRTVRTNA